MCPMLTVSRENTFDEFIGYRYQGNTLREGFFYTEKKLGERVEYTGYNPIDVDVARVARTVTDTPSADWDGARMMGLRATGYKL